jgi:hypothetical protein
MRVVLGRLPDGAYTGRHGRIWRSTPLIGPSILPLPEQARETAFGAWFRPFPGQAAYGRRERAMEHPCEIFWDGALLSLSFKYRTQRGLPLMRIKSQAQSDQAKKNSAPGHAVCGKSDPGPWISSSAFDGANSRSVGPQKADTALAKGKPLRRLSECSRSGSGA